MDSPAQPPAIATQTKKTRRPRKKKADIPTFKVEHGNFCITFK